MPFNEEDDNDDAAAADAADAADDEDDTVDGDGVAFWNVQIVHPPWMLLRCVWST